MAEYELDKHRYRELKHFCLQYHKFKRIVSTWSEGTLEYENAIRLIEKTAADASIKYQEWILAAAVNDISYSRLKPPLNRIEFEYFLRRFYWLLSNRKGY